MSIPDQPPAKRPLLLRILLAILYWVWWLYVYICVTIVTGALIGAFLFITIGALTHPDMDVLRRIEMGLMDGFYYSGMWSGGLAIILCVMRAHRLSEQRARTQKQRGDADAVDVAHASLAGQSHSAAATASGTGAARAAGSAATQANTNFTSVDQ